MCTVKYVLRIIMDVRTVRISKGTHTRFFLGLFLFFYSIVLSTAGFKSIRHNVLFLNNASLNGIHCIQTRRFYSGTKSF